MNITPKLLIGQFITDSKNISESEKINMLSEIMYLNEEELDAWIDLTLLDESGVLDPLFEPLFEAGGLLGLATKGVQKVGKAANYTVDLVRRGLVGKSNEELKDALKAAEKAKKAKTLSGRWDSVKTGAKNIAGKFDRHPIISTVGVGNAGYIGFKAVRAVADRLNVCKSNCKEAFNISKDGAKYAACMEKCQTKANTQITDIKDKTKKKRG